MAIYTIFDGDKDKWAYARMKGWSALPNVPFLFENAHDLDSMTARAQGEEYVKRNLKLRMQQSTAAAVIIGESTKNLYKFVRWELDLALSLDLPIIAINLNGSKVQDDLCPAIIRDTCVLHVPFKLKPIKHALTCWPAEFEGLSLSSRKGGARHYSDDLYQVWEVSDS
ncbi:TIR domain-containing protein [Rhizobium sp. CFBP 8762]|uniref:TIR domain-containing protein n=1 Tax=Rhizobium sp. CFBP 8762 TaxID=2775279 RepID=UPI001786CE7C|nr:TIR domain-containing protein [Rhizobium sp. CFBP 8762]MBD8554926.1 TIR domain-containing protein [Rhizobium sp. CFBP 8762]